jgi:hypothetical protein
LRKSQIALLAFALAAAPAAHTATLMNATGDVLVNASNGFRRADEGQTITPDAPVMVGRGGGSAVIAYDLTFTESATAAQVVTAQPGAPCNAPGAQTFPVPPGEVSHLRLSSAG